MTAGPAARTSRDRLLAGDGLRAAAALSVLVYHTAIVVARYRYQGAYGPAFGSVAGPLFLTLNAGLYIFFALSGYLLARPFARAYVLGTAMPSTGRYAASRLLRILPAFWLAVTLTLLVRGAAGTDVPHIVAVYAFAQVLAPSPAAGQIIQAWTLDAEMFFYILLPVAAFAAVRLGNRRGSTPGGRAARLLVALGVVGAATAIWFAAANPWAWNTLPPMMLFAFVPGIALATIEPAWSSRFRPAIARWLVPLLLVLAAALFGVCLAIPASEIGFRAVAAAAAAGVILCGALIRQWATGTSWRLVDNRVMNWVGERSYGVYVFHVLVLAEVDRLVFHGGAWTGFAAVTVATLGLSLGLAALSWRFVEQPALRLRARLSASRRAGQPAAAALPRTESPAPAVPALPRTPYATADQS